MDVRDHNDIPADGRDYEIVTTYAEADEVLRRRDDFTAHGARGEKALDVIDATIIDLDGRAHLDRRRLLQRLLGPDQIRAYEIAVLDEALPRNIETFKAAGPDDDGTVRFDLVELARKTFWQLAAIMVGLDDIESSERIDLLARTVMPAIEAELVLFSEKDHERVHRQGLEALERFSKTFFRDSFERRRAILDRVRSGEIDISEVPVDLISLMLQSHPDDEELIIRECIVFFGGTVSNPVATAAHSLKELESWVQTHPEYEARTLDDEFLESVIRETIRLHRTGNPYLIRRAAQDITLRTTGRLIPQQRWVAIDLRKASRDPEVFGPDADSFNPERVVTAPRTKDYGLAFGIGPHVCLGKPLVVNDGGGHGELRIQSQVLKHLLLSGVRVDRTREAVPEAHGGDRYSLFPVILERRG